MFFKRMLFAVVLIVLSLPVISYAQDAETVEPVLLIGTVTDEPDVFVGLLIDGESATLYICDGQPDKGTISVGQWFVGTIADKVIDITAANGNRVEVALEDAAASGKFTFTDGSSKAFTLALAEDEAALFRSEFTFGETKYIGGWLVLANGDVRGSVFEPGTETLVPASLTGPTLPKKKES